MKYLEESPLFYCKKILSNYAVINVPTLTCKSVVDTIVSGPQPQDSC